MVPGRIALLLSIVSLGACDPPTAPATLADLYEADQLNGQPLPARDVDSFSNSAGSCAMDYRGGSVSFGESGGFDLYSSYELRCTGESSPRRSTVRLQGTYVRNGTELTFRPQIVSSDVLESGRLVGDYLFVNVRRTNGTRFEIRYGALRN